MQQNLKNFLFTISFSGKNYHGWQIQKNGNTVQNVFQNALKTIVNNELEVKGCSRTDAGVHAKMYCVSAKLNTFMPGDKIKMALNSRLPTDIVVNCCEEVDMNFHARYTCTGKEYIYKIWNHRDRNPFLDIFSYHYWYPIKIDSLKKACDEFVGRHDFTAFSKPDKRIRKNMERNVKYCDISKTENLVEIKIKADGFLYNMVRIIVGTLLKISEEKIKISDIPQIINCKKRINAGPTLPAHGLYLNKVYYD